MTGRVVALGECMLEFAPAGEALYRRGFAGDTFNTAWYLRRLLPPTWEVSYGTCVGTDPISEQMLAFIAGAGILTDRIRRVPERTVGLYMISLERGERSFTYWRGEAAARTLADDPAWLAGILAGAGLVYLSGITLAILPPEGRTRLIGALHAARAAGATVVLDPNLRLRLWPDQGTMRAAATDAAGAADIVLPSFDEERAAFGDRTPAETMARYRAAGATTVVVKNGAEEIEAWDHREGAATFTPRRVEPVDTTAAGDSFNAGFLAARLRHRPMPEALAGGASVAAVVVGAPGALVDRPLG